MSEIGDGTRSNRLTAEQHAPMRVQGASVALAAGAGCGKTTVLTERFVSFLEGPSARPLQQVVALTFTEKAARELRDRVRSTCRQRITEGSDAAHWRGILRGLEVARIGTFHNFCAAILRRYPIEAGVDPSFAILDEALAPTVRDRTLETCLRRWLASRDPDFASLAVDHGLNSVKEALGELLAKRPDLNFDAWGRCEPTGIVAIWEQFRDRLTMDLLTNLAEDNRGLLDLLTRETCTNAVMKIRCAFLLSELPRLHASADPHGTLLEIRENAKVQGGGKKDHWSSPEIFERVKHDFEQLRKQIDSIEEIFRPDDGRSLASAEMGARFSRLARETIASYTRAKDEAGLLDFNDLQTRVRDLLRHGPGSILADLAGAIDVLLVDEFQDTDAIQAEILERLAGAEALSGRLFLVGDEKQSIYGFRGARPEIFQAFRGRFPSEGRLNLTENFRSVPGVLSFVNALFEEAFPAEKPLKAGGFDDRIAGLEQPRVEFHWPIPSGTKLDVGIRRTMEATSIAQILAARLSQGWSIRDPETKHCRQAVPGDVAILFRSRSDFPLYERALEAVSLDYHVIGGSTYFAQQEVIDLINLLSTIEDPLDPLALAGTLRGPICGVSDEGLFWLATAGNGDLPTAFQDWERISPSLAADDRRAVGRASVLLSRWRAEKDHIPMATILDRVLQESGFEAALLGDYLGERKRANVRKLVRFARRFDEQGAFTLADFVARLRADLKTPPREEQAATTDEQGQAIRLMTIHQAKGLEFPIVVLADLNRRSPNSSELVSYHPELGVLVRASSKADEEEVPTWNLGRALADKLDARAEREESLRVFYVATTRARDSLIVSAGIAAGESPVSPALELLADRFDLATGECRAELPGDWPRPAVRVIDPKMFEPSGQAEKARARPKILSAARQISRAQPPFDEEVATPRDRVPGWAMLDPQPQSATLREVARLFRIVLGHPSSCGNESIDELVARVASASGTWTSARVRTLVGDHVAAWRSTPICRSVRRAELVRYAIPWTLAWPPENPVATVFSGRIDLACRDASAGWNLIRVSLENEEDARDREELNVRLSAFAAPSFEISPVASAWIVTLGSSVSSRRIEGFDVPDIQKSIRALR